MWASAGMHTSKVRVAKTSEHVPLSISRCGLVELRTGEERRATGHVYVPSGGGSCDARSNQKRPANGANSENMPHATPFQLFHPSIHRCSWIYACFQARARVKCERASRASRALALTSTRASRALMLHEHSRFHAHSCFTRTRASRAPALHRHLRFTRTCASRAIVVTVWRCGLRVVCGLRALVSQHGHGDAIN
jgi:hypothetical protein